MMAGIREILIISTPHDTPLIRRLLGSGKQWGVELSYAVQAAPDGLAQAFTIGAEFIGQSSAALVLGDNIFYGDQFPALLKGATSQDLGATVFGYRVSDPERYGIVEMGPDGRAISLEEKPVSPRSQFAVTGLYFYDNKVVEIARSVRPSPRGELEITDINKAYLELGELDVKLLGRGYTWLDTGTHESLLDASTFVSVLQHRQGLVIASPEEISFSNGWINEVELIASADLYGKSAYGAYIRGLLAS
jgi:glucose-1-phosphate thymidylyltransferase